MNQYIDYLQYTLLNEQAAQSVWQDALESSGELETIAGSLPYCRNEKLKKLGYRLKLFRKHRYVMIYRTDKQTAYVDAVYHELQDFENLFSREMNDSSN